MLFVPPDADHPPERWLHEGVVQLQDRLLPHRPGRAHLVLGARAQTQSRTKSPRKVRRIRQNVH